MTLPLEGIRIIGFSQFGAGPYGSLQMADLGAEIIKIEDPTTEGDVARRVPPYLVDGVNDSIYFQAFNRNKKSVTLNLRTPRGKEVVERLVKVSHGVYSNFRGDLPTRLGLTYADLCHANPAIVCCHLSGYGMNNARSADPAYDYLVQGEVGAMSITGEPGGPPVRSGIPIVDLAGALASAYGMMAGIVKSLRTGQGCDIDVSLYDTMASMMSYMSAWHLTSGFEMEREPAGSHPTLVPSQNFQTSNGWIVIMCAKEVFFQNLADLLGHPEWKEDPRFETFADRLANREELVALLNPEFRKHTSEHLLTIFRGKVPSAPILDFAQAMTNPLLTERGMILDIEHPVFGTIKEMRGAVMAPGEKTPTRPAPHVGEHTDEVLRDLAGYTPGEIRELRNEGAV